MKKVIILGVMVTLTLVGALLMNASGCNVTVMSPTAGEIWYVGQTYNLTWSASHYCPSKFSKIELCGRTATAGDVVLQTLNNVNISPSTRAFTPTASMVGYPKYLFKFYAEESQYLAPDLRIPSAVGTSPEFYIQALSPPLETDPAGFTLQGYAGQGTITKNFWVISNEGTIPWTASSNQSWLLVSPTQGSSTEGSTATKGTLTVDLVGLVPGNYEGLITFTGTTRETVEAVLSVQLQVSSSTGGTPELVVTPSRYTFVSLLGATPQSQTCTLQNTGSGAAIWQALEDIPWLSVSPSSGQLGPGAAVSCTLSVSSSMQRAGSHGGYIHFTAEGSEDAVAAVAWTVRPQAFLGSWTGSGDPTRTLPIVATGLGGAEGSFWSSDAHALPWGPTARATCSERASLALDNLLKTGDPVTLDMDTLHAYRDRLTAESDGVTRGTNRFIWGAMQQKVRSTSAMVMDFDMDDMFSVMMLDLLGDYFQQDAASGFVQVRGTGVEDMIIQSRTFTTDIEGKTYGQSITSPESDEIMGAEGGATYVLGLVNSERFRSNLFITEISGVSAEVLVKLFDENGNLTGNPLSRTMEPFSQWQLTNVFYQSNSTAPRGYAVVYSDGGGSVHVLGSVIDRDTNDPTTIPGVIPSAVTRATEDLFLPAAVHAPGSAGTQWRSDVTLLNASATSQTFTVEYIPESGNSGDVIPQEVTMPAWTMAVYDDIVFKLFGVELGKGTVAIRSVDPSQIFAFNRIYNLLDNGWTYGQGTMAFRSKDAVTNGSGTLFILGLEHSPKFRSNVGLVEIGGASATVFVTVDPFFEEPRGLTFNLNPGQLLQVNNIIRDYAGYSNDLTNVYVMVDVISGTGHVATYGSIVDYDSSDATFIRGILR
ncbi:MAG TPA: hypothetical protein PK014_00065 [Thermoanaerobaculia bacterium]|nr:hypothetical protein [Thermoanaerobaculia bacterium]HXK69108.1 hypothetical protein [Thermoanaerobaculia bacterium]